jgi:DNA-binding CsgD family transcriptional regulator
MDDVTRQTTRSADSSKLLLHGDAFVSALGTRMLLAQAIELLPVAVAIVTDDLHVCAMNSAAKTLVDGREGFAVSASRLACLNGSSQQLLEQSLRRLRESYGIQRRAALRVARTSKCDLQLLIVALSSEPNSASVSQWCIYIFDTAASMDATLLRELHGLTETEATVAGTLFDTGSIEAAADQLEVSINTVKTHLKNIFKKCGVRSQAELLRMLALGPR